jgi:hypothetical protein
MKIEDWLLHRLPESKINGYKDVKIMSKFA